MPGCHWPASLTLAMSSIVADREFDLHDLRSVAAAAVIDGVRDCFTDRDERRVARLLSDADLLEPAPESTSTGARGRRMRRKRVDEERGACAGGSDGDECDVVGCGVGPVVDQRSEDRLLEAAKRQVPVCGDNGLESGEADIDGFAFTLDEPVRVEQQQRARGHGLGGGRGSRDRRRDAQRPGATAFEVSDACRRADTKSGGGCPALAYETVSDSGSTIAKATVVHLAPAMRSAYRSRISMASVASLACIAVTASAARNCPIVVAAGRPRPTTSPTATASLPSSRITASYQSPPISIVASEARYRARTMAVVLRTSRASRPSCNVRATERSNSRRSRRSVVRATRSAMLSNTRFRRCLERAGFGPGQAQSPEHFARDVSQR